jgi:preprotein translocase subunit YajC
VCFSSINIRLLNIYEGNTGMKSLWILAQASPNAPSASAPPPVTAEPVVGTTAITAITSAPNTPAHVPGPVKQPSTPTSFYLLLVLMAVLLYFMMVRGPRKKQQQQRQMIQSLKKNDRVQTIGGILGTVIDVKDDEITLKVDESNNTKIKIVAGAISRVLSEEKK